MSSSKESVAAFRVAHTANRSVRALRGAGLQEQKQMLGSTYRNLSMRRFAQAENNSQGTAAPESPRGSAATAPDSPRPAAAPTERKHRTTTRLAEHNVQDVMVEFQRQERANMITKLTSVDEEGVELSPEYYTNDSRGKDRTLIFDHASLAALKTEYVRATALAQQRRYTRAKKNRIMTIAYAIVNVAQHMNIPELVDFGKEICRMVRDGEFNDDLRLKFKLAGPDTNVNPDHNMIERVLQVAFEKNFLPKLIQMFLGAPAVPGAPAGPAAVPVAAVAAGPVVAAPVAGPVASPSLLSAAEQEMARAAGVNFS